MYQNFSISIVLPLYNPKGNWFQEFIENISELKTYLPQQASVQYIVVHDGPPSELVTMAFELLAETIDNISFISYEENMGKGYALRQGVKAAITPYVLMIDFDFPYVKNNVVELIKSLHKGNDVVVGKRSKYYFQKLPLKRKIISKAYSFLNWVCFDLPLYDTQSGIKGFNRRGREVFLQTTVNRFLVDTEFILRAHRKKLSIGIINIQLKPNVAFSNFGSSVIKTELKNFFTLLQLNEKLNQPTEQNYSSFELNEGYTF